MTLRRQRRDWEELAAIDPLWAILSDPAKRGGRWELDEFLESGIREIEAIRQRSEALGHPRKSETALDFGCGVGRNTRALAGWFDRAIGLDVSAEMVIRARALNQDIANCRFETNDAQDLGAIEAGSIDLVYSTLVLQHMLSEGLIRGYIREFVRVLAPGGLAVFQLPTEIPLRYRLQPRRHLYRLLRRVGLPASQLQRRGLHPISMRAIPRPAVVSAVEEAGGEILGVDESEIPGFGIASATYWLTRR